jgi:hypothetical protein
LKKIFDVSRDYFREINYFRKEKIGKKKARNKKKLAITF